MDGLRRISHAPSMRAAYSPRVSIWKEYISHSGYPQIRNHRSVDKSVKSPQALACRAYRSMILMSVFLSPSEFHCSVGLSLFRSLGGKRIAKSHKRILFQCCGLTNKRNLTLIGIRNQEESHFKRGLNRSKNALARQNPNFNRSKNPLTHPNLNKEATIPSYKRPASDQ